MKPNPSARPGRTSVKPSSGPGSRWPPGALPRGRALVCGQLGAAPALRRRWCSLRPPEGQAGSGRSAAPGPALPAGRGAAPASRALPPSPALLWRPPPRCSRLPGAGGPRCRRRPPEGSTAAGKGRAGPGWGLRRPRRALLSPKSARGPGPAPTGLSAGVPGPRAGSSGRARLGAALLGRGARPCPARAAGPAAERRSADTAPLRVTRWCHPYLLNPVPSTQERASPAIAAFN